MSKQIKFLSLIVITILILTPFFIKPEKIFFQQTQIINTLNIKTTLFNISEKNIVYVKCKFKNAGTLSDHTEKHGISTIYSALIFKKFENLSVTDVKEKFENLGITNLNVDSTTDDLIISFYVVTNKITEAMTFIGQAFANNKFSNNDIEYMKNKFPHMLNVDSSFPSDLLHEKLMKTLYPNHNYGLNTSGTTHAIATINEEDLKDFIKRKIAKNNLEIIFAGDLSTFVINDYLKLLFKKIPDECSENIKIQPLNKFPTKNAFKNIQIIKRKNLNDIIGISHGVRIDNPSNIEIAALYVALTTIFDANGEFINELKINNIAYLLETTVIKNNLSFSIFFTVFIEKNDKNNYLKLLEKKINQYQQGIKNTEITELYYQQQLENGFINLNNIDEQIKNKYLPFNKLNKQIYKNICKKLFDVNQMSIVIIGDL